MQKKSSAEIADFIDGLAPKHKPEAFYYGWKCLLVNFYEKSLERAAESEQDCNNQKVSLSEICVFDLNYNIKKAKEFARFSSYKTVSGKEIKDMEIIFDAKNRDKNIPYGRPLKNPLLIVAECPYGTKFKLVAIAGARNLSERINRNLKIDYVKLPRNMTALTISDPFQRAWYTFIDEYERYSQLQYPAEKKRFMNNSELYRMIDCYKEFCRSGEVKQKETAK